jgi:hypothetical protein
MNKKQLTESIMLLAKALKKEVVTSNLDVDALTTLHEKLSTEKNAEDEALTALHDNFLGETSAQAEQLAALHEKLSVKKSVQNEALSMISDQAALSTQAKVVLTFIAPHKRYSNGDVAGFDADVAKSILDLKPPVAKAYQTDKETEKEADNAAEK